MPRINLLPWREELRKQKQQEYAIALGVCAAFAAMVVLIVHMYFSGHIDRQTMRNDFLKAEIATLDKKIAEIKALEKEKESLIARMKAIETLQTSRPLIVHLFDELVTSLPEGVYLTKVSQQGQKVTVSGVAQSNARVSSYMRNIESSEWLTDPKLSIIQTGNRDARRVAEFNLTMTQAIPNADAEDEE